MLTKTSQILRPRKRFSQNFLVDNNLKLKILDLISSFEFDEIWEIGPGTGVFTQHLLRIGKPLKAFEIDGSLCQNLKQRFPNLVLEEGDFLKSSLKPSLETLVFSNLPYHISSPVLFKILGNPAVLVFQKEFAERLMAKERTKDYGILSVLVQNTYRIQKGPILPASVFFPRPKVESQAIALIPKEEIKFNLQKTVRVAFSHRRKKLSNNLSSAFAKEKVEAAFKTLRLEPTARAEELSLEEYQTLAQILES